MMMSIQSPPAFLSRPRQHRSGINFATGGAGILNATHEGKVGPGLRAVRWWLAHGLCCVPHTTCARETQMSIRMGPTPLSRTAGARRSVNEEANSGKSGQAMPERTREGHPPLRREGFGDCKAYAEQYSSSALSRVELFVSL